MSSDTGIIYSLEGKIEAYYQYAGTSDVAVSHLFNSSEELWGTHVNGQGFDNKWIDCECGKDSIDCWLWTGYGGGFYWPGQWCPTCRAITEGFDPYREREISDCSWKEWEDLPPFDGRPPNAEVTT